MNTSKLFFSLLFASIMGGAIAIGGYKLFIEEPINTNSQNQQDVVLSNYDNEDKQGFITSSSQSKSNSSSNYVIPGGLNFMGAAEKVTPAVVHIKTTYDANASAYGKNSLEEMFKEFFGDEGGEYYGRGGQRMSSGSGVIITQDGYIATNNHVIDNATSIEVVLNDKRRYEAEIVGTDPTTDLALLKITEVELPFVPFGDSDEVKIGQWVLAVGNPFDLTSTVTAGIVSAKARNINILRSRGGSQYSIESFIQTDAAVNPGNSGGALVDLEGNLVGINTAIATTTGSYSGYSFAVPATLVKKVMDDLVNYGEVQRALMGVSIVDITAELAEDQGIDEIKGIYIAGVNPGSGADDADIQRGDIILSIDESDVNTVSELQELVARNRPGDEIIVKIKRSGNVQDVKVTLKNKKHTTELVAKEDTQKGLVPTLGAEVEEVSEIELSELGINSGIKVVELKPGKLKAAEVDKGFIITHVDKTTIKTVEQLNETLDNVAEGEGVLIEGMYPNGEKAFYGIGF